jgi:hypothetical protein
VYQQREAAEQLQRNLAKRGVKATIGQIHHGPLTTTLSNVSFSFPRAPKATATAEYIEVVGSWLHRPTFHVPKLTFNLEGAPTELLPSLLSYLDYRTPLFKVDVLNAEYQHRALGKLRFSNLRLERAYDGLVIRANQVARETKIWNSVALFAHSRNQMVEIALDNTSINDSKTQIGYYPERGNVEQWMLVFRHQPTRNFVQKLGYALGPNFEDSRIGGSLTLVVPTDPNLPIRGNVQLVLDRWPKPQWQEASRLLGNTVSFFARIEPSPDNSHWDLLDADVRLALFTLHGTGRLKFAPFLSVTLDVQGERRCAQLEANLPPSSYATQVTQYLARAESNRKRRAEETSLRFQLATNGVDITSSLVAWRLTAGCGIAEMTSGDFTQLTLPLTSERAKENTKQGLSLIRNER